MSASDEQLFNDIDELSEASEKALENSQNSTSTFTPPPSYITKPSKLVLPHLDFNPIIPKKKTACYFVNSVRICK